MDDIVPFGAALAMDRKLRAKQANAAELAQRLEHQGNAEAGAWAARSEAFWETRVLLREVLTEPARKRLPELHPPAPEDAGRDPFLAAARGGEVA